MSEAFVKTPKRDYASTATLPDADTILALLPEWIDDFCEVHPHSGLKLRSPAHHAISCASVPKPNRRLSGEKGATPPVWVHLWTFGGRQMDR